MTKQEFVGLLPDGARAPSDEEFAVIDLVYMYHPSISDIQGKYEIMSLYVLFGIRIIYDMKETALKAKAIEDKRRELQAELEQLELEEEELSMI